MSQPVVTYRHNGITVETSNNDGCYVHITSDDGREAHLQGDDADDFRTYAYLVAEGQFGEDKSLNEVFCTLAIDYLP